MDAHDVSSHPAIIALTNASTVISALGEDAKTKSGVAELSARIDYLIWVLEQTDPNLLSRAELDSLSGNAQNINSYISTIAANPTSNAQATGSQLDVYFARFPYPRFKKIPRSESKQIIEQVQAQADQSLASLNIEYTKLLKKINDLEADINDQTAAISNLEANISNTEDRQGAAFKDADMFSQKTISSLEAKIEERLTEANARLSTAIDTFNTKSSEDHATAAAQISEISSERKTSAELADRKLSEAISGIITSGDKYLQKIRDIYGIVGGEASSGHLIKSAQSEYNSYRALGILAFLFFIGGSFMAYRAIEPALAPGVDWHILVGRIGLVVASYIPAWFLASLATKHRLAELAYRSLAVRVAAFDPYVSEFDTNERIGLKKQLAEMFFSPSLNQQNSDKLSFKDLKDFERVVAPLESIIEKLRAFATKT